MINSITINAIKNNSEKPFVQVICNGVSTRWLYDTGADVSVINVKLFNEIKKRGKIVQLDKGVNLTTASKDSLKIQGRYNLKLNVLGQSVINPIYVCENLNQMAIMGIDLMRKLNLTYNFKKSEFQINSISPVSSQILLVTKSSEKIPALTARPLRLQGTTQDGQRPPLGAMAIAKIQNDEFPCLYADKGLVSPNRNGEVTVWVKNCHPFDILLERNEGVGSLEIVDSKQISLIDQDKFLKEIQSVQKSPPPLSSEQQKEFLKKINLNVPENERLAYEKLFIENYDIFSKDKNDLRFS